MGSIGMKNLQLLTWLTQLGLSTAIPLAGFVLLAVWLRNRFGLGSWVLFIGIGLGVICAVDGFYKSLKALSSLTKDTKGTTPPVSYTEHD
jgi:hypothetical protein